MQMETLSLSTPRRRVRVAQITLNLDTRKRRVVRIRLRPSPFISGKKTTFTFWRCGLVKHQQITLKNRITYRTAGRDVRTNERCS
jgi:hypothetical protein